MIKLLIFNYNRSHGLPSSWLFHRNTSLQPTVAVKKTVSTKLAVRQNYQSPIPNSQFPIPN
ncbi:MULTISPECIES: hypothetical protein [unclassified Microcoleus]|uniref:hypothetical protein n=1 Tax=unclassified Microcoleus TaxID=2642155 RepID=UPI001E043F19|nr:MULTISPECIES: hypothetical protein [unclassified Microcoleus]MCC3417332.1 hypothetical protein [Microcoleus sp. PH2017_07_MST_O_A]MCC3440877.1 hypothetical protein [Microcoleus sp. PH2017_03_ELD_O_A]MCC3466804.1 hypothetical protein [Microcoleus sp. PH2017_06_SFM_O_A]MCC3497613.1 hypothetical protein [Microcoleus sp. PH2017_15_JOR_U_A]MCC3502348.1 hypothetical protein [Microcoleus sp. PH2017_19_SFW_U_A]MCC3508955.1 hypothetical protein [Microcoleus sp. PH2017_17_BER_D_A]MCC3521221.1 hypot